MVGWSRRRALSNSIVGIFALLARASAFAKPWQDKVAEFDLIDDPDRGEWGKYDVASSLDKKERAAIENFVYPDNADSPSLYGIDISHHTKETPWKDLADSKVSYVYIKSSQGRSARDPKFFEHWRAAEASKLPYGAYHFLSAGIPGVDQANWFLKRLHDAGGLHPGHLQPVLDLEWDILGPEFKKTRIGTNKHGKAIYLDYWETYRAQIVPIVRDAAQQLVKALQPLGIRPLIYTNRSWWESFPELNGIKFDNCTIWISDYREASYGSQQPRAVKLHEYYLWQFTEKATVRSGNKQFGPFDSNKLMHGGIENIRIV